jgi:hypothetical protein
MRLMPKEDEDAWRATVAMEEEEVEHAIVAKAKEVSPRAPITHLT